MPGAVRAGFSEEAMPEPLVMSLIQTHLNVSERVYMLHTGTHAHTYTHMNIAAL